MKNRKRNWYDYEPGDGVAVLLCVNIGALAGALIYLLTGQM